MHFSFCGTIVESKICVIGTLSARVVVLRGILGRGVGEYVELSCGRVMILNVHSFYALFFLFFFFFFFYSFFNVKFWKRMCVMQYCSSMV